LIKEIRIYLAIITIMALVWHSKQFLNYPIEHIEHLLNSGIFILHPFAIGAGIYLFIGIFRLLFKKLISNKQK